MLFNRLSCLDACYAKRPERLECFSIDNLAFRIHSISQPGITLLDLLLEDFSLLPTVNQALELLIFRNCSSKGVVRSRHPFSIA
jgi:hypothetical protein